MDRLGGGVWWYLVGGVYFLFVVFMWGLSVALMSVGADALEFVGKSGTETDKKQAETMILIVWKGHQLLVTLVLCTCAAMALCIHLGNILAVVFCAGFLLLYGEVNRRRMSTRYGLAVGANYLGLVRVLMMVCYPIAYPAGKILNAITGHRGLVLDRAQLKAFFAIHSKEAGLGGELTHSETRVMSRALDMTEKTAKEAMTPIESAFSVDFNSELDWEAGAKILAKGICVPVYDGNPMNIIGVVQVTDLFERWEAKTKQRVADVTISNIRRVPADMCLHDILPLLRENNRISMVAVVESIERSQQVIGIITFQDFIQDLLHGKPVVVA